MPIERVVSGGQTGTDRAALDAALGFGIEVGGWVPKGRVAEDGLIPARYPNLTEAETEDPARRTELNVLDSNATLILSNGELVGGSQLTREKAVELGRPWRHVDFAKTPVPDAVTGIVQWLAQVQPRILNVAGPRASEDLLIYDTAKRALEGVFMNENLQVLLNLRESTLAQCGRWDEIRWQVPSWFCTLGTLCLGFVALYKTNASTFHMARLFFGAVGVFGSLCFLLLIKLVLYEIKVISDFNRYLDEFPVGDTLIKALKLRRPFSFEPRRIWRTATFWFLLYILGLTIFFFARFFGVEVW